DVGVLEQAVRDLQRGDVDPALDDDVLLAPGDVDVAVLVAPREIAVAEPVLRNRYHLVRSLPVGRGELAPADDHLTLVARRQLPSGLVEDAQTNVEGRPAGRAELPVTGRIAAHEARLGTAGQLHDRDAVGLLELLVLVDGERRGARGHEAERRQVGLRHAHRTRQQHVDHGRNSDGYRHAMAAQPLEEPRLRELLREHQGGTGQEARSDRQDLRRGPAEGADVEDRVAFAELEPVDRGLAHGVVRLVRPDGALRGVGRARRVVDQRPVRARGTRSNGGIRYGGQGGGTGCGGGGGGAARRARGTRSNGGIRYGGQAGEQVVGRRGRRVPGAEGDPRRAARRERTRVDGQVLAPEHGPGRHVVQDLA